MSFAELYNSNPRDYAMALLEEGTANSKSLLVSCLKFMSAQDVRDMLDDNELSPRFFESEDQDTEDEDIEDGEWCVDEISSEERNACDHYNERYVTSCRD